MKQLLAQLITTILRGQDYRPLVLATINREFVQHANELSALVFAAKQSGNENW